jgi:hypothetical protein
MTIVRGLAAAETRAIEIGIAVNIAVLDAGTHMKAFDRIHAEGQSVDGLGESDLNYRPRPRWKRESCASTCLNALVPAIPIRITTRRAPR